MGYAKHVGRVGALAVALGVGAAVATTPGIAWADTGSGASSTDSAGGGATSTSTGSPSSTSSPGSSASSAPASDTQPTTTTASTGSSSSQPGGDVVVSSSGAHTSTTSAKSSSIKTTKAPKASKPAKPPANAAPTAAHTPTPQAHFSVQTATGAFTATQPAATHSAATAASVIHTLAPAVPMTQALAVAPTVVNASVRMAAGVVGALTSLVFGSGPGGAVDSPALWVLAAAARRQFGQSADESQTTAAPMQLMATNQALAAPAATTVKQPPAFDDPANPATFGTPDPTTGAVTGQIHAHDPDTTTLSYTVTTAPSQGTVTMDKKTGVFTYTPTAAQRVLAQVTPGDQTAQFAVTVSDGTTSHNQTATVDVTIDPTQITDLKTIPGDFQAAVAATNTRAYVTNAGGESVSVIDTIHGTPVTDLFAGNEPVGIAVTPDGKKVYVVDAIDGTLSVIDADADTSPTTIALTDKRPYSLAMSPNGKTLYVGSVTVDDNGAPIVGTDGTVTGGTITRISTSTDRVSGTAKNVAFQPLSITVSPDGKKLYVISDEIDPATLEPSGFDVYQLSSTGTKGTLVSGVGTPTSLAVSRDDSKLFVASADGTLRVLETKKYTVTDTIDLGTVLNSMTVNGDGSLLVATTSSGAINTYDTSNFAELTSTPDTASSFNPFPQSVLSPDGMQVYVLGDDGLHIISLVPVDTFPVAGPATVSTPSAATGVVTGDINASDPDNDPLKFAATTPTKGAVVLNPDGTFTYTPTAAARHAAAADGADSAATHDTFTVTVDDGRRGIVTVPVTVDIAPTDIAPVTKFSAGSPSSSTGIVKGTVTATDKDKDVLTYETSGTTAKGGTVTLDAKGRYVYTPTAAARHAAATSDPAAKTDTFTVTVDDGHGSPRDVLVTVKVGATNNKPDNTAYTLGTPDAATGAVVGTVTATDADHDDFTLTGPATTKKGAITYNSADDTFTYTPTAAARAAAGALGASTSTKTDKFTVTVADGHGGTDTVSVTVTIAPTAAPGDQNPTDGHFTANAPGSGGTVTGTVTATDPDGDPLSYSGTQTTDQGHVTVQSTGAYTYTPTSDARHAASADGAPTSVTQDTFDVTVSDGRGGTLTVPVTVPVSPTNTAPSGSFTASAPNSDTGVVTGTVTSTDAENDTRTYSGPATSTKGGAVSVAANGSFTYTPTTAARQAAGAPGATDADKHDTFTVTVDDGHQGGTSTVTVTVGVAPPAVSPNHNPTNGQFTTNGPGSNGSVTGTVTATDPDGDPLSYSGPTTSARGGALSVASNGAFTYTPTAAISHAASTTGAGPSLTQDTFSVTVSDGHGGTLSVPVTVTVSPVDTAPDNGSFTASAANSGSGQVTGTVSATDADGDALTYTAPATTSKGALTLNTTTGAYTFTPTAAAMHTASVFNATYSDTHDTFTVTADDGHGGTIPVTVTVGVNPENQAPVAGTTTVDTPNASTGVVTGTAPFTDADGDTILYRVFTPAKGSVTVDPVTGAFTYTPTLAARQQAAAAGATAADKADTVTIVADDGYGAQVPVTIAVPVLGSTDAAPVAGTPSVTTNATTGVVTGSANFTDPNGNPLTYTVAPAMRGTVTINPTTGAFTYTPTAAARQQAATWSATTTDKQDTIVITADDGLSGITTTAITVPVTAANNATDRAPVAGTTVFGAPDATTGAITGAVSVSDPDSDPLTYSVSSYPAKGHITLDSSTGTFTYTPEFDYRHTAASDTATAADKADTFTITADDLRGKTTAVVVNVVVSPSNSAPDHDIYGSTTVNAPNSAGVVTGSVNYYDSDYDNRFYPGLDTLVYTASTPTKGTVTLTPNGYSTAQFTYTPTDAARQQAASAGATAADRVDSFTITATDGHGGSTPVTVVVGVLPTGVTPNAAPTSSGAFVLTGHDTATGATTGTVPFHDNNNDTLTYTAINPSKGTVTVDPTTGAFTYTPTAAARHAATAAGATDADAQDSFTIVAADGHGNVALRTVTLPTGYQNATPVLGATTVGSPNPTTGVVTGKVTADDPDNDTITYYISSPTTAKGSVSLNTATGDFTYTPAAAARYYAGLAGATDAAKSDTFTITAYDSHSSYASQVVTVAISPSSAPNHAPVQNAPTTVGAPDPTTGAVSGSFHLTDPDRDAITYTITPINGSTPSDGVFVMDDGNFTVNGETGNWTFLPTDERRHEASLPTGGRPDVYSFHWTATDSRGATVGGDVSVPIVPANAAPVPSSESEVRDPSTGVFTGTFTATDADDDYLTTSVTEQPAHGTVTTQWVGGSTYQWIYTPAAGHVTDGASFELMIDDGHGGYSFDFEGADQSAPTSSTPPVTTGTTTNRPANTATGAVNGNVSVANPLGHTLTYTVTGNPVAGSVTINQTTGAYTYTPTAGARIAAAASGAPKTALTGSFTVTVTDGAQTVAVVPITVPISPLNSRPHTQITVSAPDVNGVITGRVTATDPDGDQLTYSGPTTTRLDGYVQIGSDGSFTYTPNESYRLLAAKQPVKDFFTVTITEQAGEQTLVNVPVDVTPLVIPATPLAPSTPSDLPPNPPAPGPGGGGGGGSSAPPAGVPENDILDNPGRHSYPIAGLKVSTKFVGEVKETIDPGQAYIYHEISTVTITAPKDALPNGDQIYAIQVVNGRAVAATPLAPGQSITGLDIVDEAQDLYGCMRGITCVSNTTFVLVFPYGPGTFPTDLLPPNPDNGYPENGDDPELEKDATKDRGVYRKVKCIVSAIAGAATIVSEVPESGSSEEAIVGAILSQVNGNGLQNDEASAAVTSGHGCLTDT